MTTVESFVGPHHSVDEQDWPAVDHLITEDDTPVDNVFSEKQQRLLTRPLYSGWKPEGGRSFIVAANVGVFAVPKNPAIVPDVLLSMDVQAPQDLWKKRNRSYMVWVYGKPPDVVIEVVSNKEGGEATEKVRIYADMVVRYYVIFDPEEQIMPQLLTCYRLDAGVYVPCAGDWWPEIGLGVRLWDGAYEEIEATWLRWCDEVGNVIPTGQERSEAERQRAEAANQRAAMERERAEAERQQAAMERERAERLAERLRALGIDMDA